MRSVRDYLIDKILEIKDFEVIANIEDKELFLLNESIIDLLNDEFIETATEKGIAKRENFFKIQPFADDTLESRKFRLNAKWNSRLPYTHKQLIERLNSLVGENGYTLSIQYLEYTLVLKINLGQKRMLQEAKNMIRNIAPCNLAVSVELQYNRHIDLSKFTHQQLSQKTHLELREEVL
jgi:predicted nucleotidyltransferase